MDLSIRLLREMEIEENDFTLREMEILNEGFSDFLQSVKDMSYEKLKKIFSAKYEQILKMEKESSNVLKRNGVDYAYLKGTIEKTVSRYKSKIMNLSGSGNMDKLQILIKMVTEDIVSNLQEKKRKPWIDLKHLDPTPIIVPLAVSIIVLAAKAIILWFTWPILSAVGSASVISVVMAVIFAFIVSPVIEEIGKLFTVRTNTSGGFLIIFNALDFGLMFATKILTHSSMDILMFILLRVIAFGGHMATNMIHKAGQKEGTQKNAAAIAMSVNMLRNMIEIVLIFTAKVAEAASKAPV